MRTFKAAVLEELNQPFAIRELNATDSLDVGQVLVSIKYSGICGSQLGEQSGVKGPDKYLPHTVGHESGAVVIETGPGVRYVKTGDHVVVHWRKGVGIDAAFPRYYCPELGKFVGAGSNNTFQELSIVSENRLTKIPDDFPLDEAALLGCAIGTGIGCVVNECQVKPGQSVIVIGCGGVGLNLIQGCSLVSAYPIIGIDLLESKLLSAQLMGATEVCTSLQGYSNVDICIDTTGNPAIIEQAWMIAKKVCLVAQMHHSKVLAINTTPMQSGKQIFGSDGGATDPTADIPRYVKLVTAGKLRLRDLITHRTDLAGVNDMFAEIRAGNVGRAIIEM